MRKRVFCVLFAAVSLRAMFALAATPLSDALFDSAWCNVMSVYYSPKTGGIYSCPPAEVEPASSYENGFRIWRKNGDYGRGLEDCAIVGGVALSMLCDKYLATGDKTVSVDATKVAHGLVNLVTVHGVPGFVARGICVEDGKSVCALSSIDQHTHCVHGLWRYVKSGLASGKDKDEAVHAITAIADRMTHVITPENDWSFPQAVGNGTTRGICKMWKNRPHEAARLPMMYAAAWDVTGREEYRTRYENLFDEALSNSLRLATLSTAEIQRWMPNYTLLQMNTSLGLLHAVERDAARRAKIRRAMCVAADLAVVRARANGSGDGFWLCSCGELALAQLMTPGYGLSDEQRRILEGAMCAKDLRTAVSTRSVHLAAAWWRGRRTGVLLKDIPRFPQVGVKGGETEHDRWHSPSVPVESDRLYQMTYETRRMTPGGGLIVGGTDGANFDRVFSDDRPHVFRQIFRTMQHDGVYSERLHFGGWRLDGEVSFVNAVLLPVHARHREVAGMVLGHGEKLVGRDYEFATALGCAAGSDARPLMKANAYFNTYRWCLSRHSEVMYRHDLAGRKWRRATIAVSCGHYEKGTATVEVRADGRPWRTLGYVNSVSTFMFPLPNDLLPARVLDVCLRGGDDCGLQVMNYVFSACVDGAEAFAIGESSYVADGSGEVVAHVAPPSLYRDGYGARLPAVRGAPFEPWCAEAEWKVARFTPCPVARTNALEMSLAANETEAMQLILRAVEPLADIKVAVGDLCGTGGVIPAKCVDVLRVGYVNVVKPSDSAGCRGLWPDPLPPQTGNLSVAAGDNQPFWIRVKVPKGAAKGEYEGRVTTTARTAAGTVFCAEFPLKVHVFGFSLPDEMTCETSFGFWFNTPIAYHGLKTESDRRSVLGKYMKTLADHHLSPQNPAPLDPWTVTWRKDADGLHPVFDWSRWDVAVRKAMSESHFNTLRINVQGIGGGTYKNPILPSLGGLKPSDAGYDRLMAEYFGEIQAHLEMNGWLDKAYVYAFDEPETKDYPFVRQQMDALKKYAPKIRRMVAEEPQQALAGGPNVWCAQTSMLKSGSFDACKKAGDRFWWYLCCDSQAPYLTLFIDHPGTELRLWLWQTWQNDVNGVSVWETVYWNSPVAYPDRMAGQNPYLDPMSWSDYAALKSDSRRPWGNGDGRLLYPPLSVSCGASKAPVLDAPVDTMRLEMLRDGIEDYEYFSILKRFVDKMGDRLTVRQKRICDELIVVPEDVSRSLVSFAEDPAGMKRHRARLAAAIEQLAAKYTK